MSDHGNDLHSEFPNASAALNGLKLSSAHFRKLASHYHELNKQIGQIETQAEPASDRRHEDLKKQRLQALDGISRAIAEFAPS